MIRGANMKLKNALLSGILAAVCCFGLTGCKEKASQGNTDEEITFKGGDKIAEITIENYGTITAKLFPEICVFRAVLCMVTVQAERRLWTKAVFSR